MMISRFSGSCCGLLALTASAVPVAAQPLNVITIITDDAGWADYGFMRDAIGAADPGNRGAVPTPNLDALAGMGVAFTDAYTASVCSPSRAMIATGQYGNRFGYGTNISGNSSPINTTNISQGLPTEITTVWEHMQGAGYATAAVGKWHLGEHTSGGGQMGNRPQYQGVEHFLGLHSGSRNYTVGGVTGSGEMRQTLSDGAGGGVNTSVVEGNYSGQYVTDVIGDESVNYIADRAGGADPFFLYTSFTAPHTPLQATAADLAFIDSLGESAFTGNRRTYAAMQYAMDRNVGKILDSLEDPNGDGNTADSIVDNTMIIFINDNGGDCCDSSPNASDNGDLRGGKGNQWEGGMRVPMIVAGAGVDPSVRGTVSGDLVHAIDIVPTALIGAGGGSFAPGTVMDGVNLLPYINGTVSGVAHEDLFISRYSGQQSAVRRGDWKYLYQGGSHQLYDLSTDIDESNNRVNDPANEGLVAELHELLISYHVQMDKPRHDNNADDTSQFDHFRFREDAFSNASFSTGSAWTDQDGGSGNATMNWRDAYANAELTFRTKASGDYVVTNDLVSVGGISYMANRINLTHAGGALPDEHTGTLAGLPILFTRSLTGQMPVLNLAAEGNAGDAGRFAFNVATDLALYDDLTISGDGDQRFEVSGNLREARAGRSVTKMGSSTVAISGNVEISGVFTVQEGEAAFANGSSVAGDLVATGGVIRVGAAPTGGGDPVDPGPDPVQDGLDLNFDAQADGNNNGTWSNVAGSNALSFAGNAASVAVNDSNVPNLSRAYDIGASGGATGLNNYFEASVDGTPRSRQDGTFEVWFHVDETDAGHQVIMEMGAGRGVSFSLDGDTLNFNVDGDGALLTIDQTLTPGWHHAVGVIDLVGDNDDLSNDSIGLYVDNVLVGEQIDVLVDDWAGGNTMAIGADASGTAGGATDDYHDQIAVARYYVGNAFDATEVDENYQWGLYEPLAGGALPTFYRLAVGGDYVQSGAATLAMGLMDVGAHDSMDVIGTAGLAGTLDLERVDGGALAYGEQIELISAASVLGNFDQINGVIIDSDTALAVTYTSTQVLVTVAIPGDANLDGDVNLLDLDVLGSAWQGSGTWAQGDFNGDGVIDLLDLDVLGANWGDGEAGFASALAASGIAVPEPAVGFMGLGAAGLARLRRHVSRS